MASTSGFADQEKWNCPHCNQYLSRKSYLYHKRLYYNHSEDCWVGRKRPRFDGDSLEDPELFDEDDIMPFQPDSCRPLASSSPPPIPIFESDDESEPCLEPEDVHMDTLALQSLADTDMDQGRL